MAAGASRTDPSTGLPAPLARRARRTRRDLSSASKETPDPRGSIARQDVSKWFGPVLLLGFTGTIYLLATRPAELPLEKALVALLIAWLGFLPLVIYLRSRHPPPMPFMPLVGLFYAVVFGLALFTLRAQRVILSSRYRIEDVSLASLWLVVGALVCLYVGFYGGWSHLWRTLHPPKIPWDSGSLELRLFVWACLGAHIYFYANPELDKLPSVGQLLEPIGDLAWGIILVFWFNGAFSAFEKCFMIPAGLLTELAFRSSSGLLSNTAIFILFLSLVMFRFRPRRALALLGAALLFLLVLSPVKNSYRQVTWYGIQNTASPFERTKLLLSLALEYYTAAGFSLATEANETALAELSQRISAISILSVVVDLTPAQVPYWGGATYRSLLTKMIPRFLWPGKPKETTGNQFGERYGFLDELDTTTSQNLPWIVELYANFGRFGVFIGMALIGLILALLNRLFNSPDMNPIEYVYGTTLLVGLIYQESSFALMVGGVLLLSVVLLFALRFACSTKRS